MGLGLGVWDAGSPILMLTPLVVSIHEALLQTPVYCCPLVIGTLTSRSGPENPNLGSPLESKCAFHSPCFSHLILHHIAVSNFFCIISLARVPLNPASHITYHQQGPCGNK